MVGNADPSVETQARRAIMTDPDMSSVRKELAFFMEKTFQISFGYFGALVALGAATKLTATNEFARTLGMHSKILFVTALLVLNATYLTLALGTLFGVLKRSLFIIESLAPISSTEEPTGYRWEVFVRHDPKVRRNAGRLRSLAWNLDNYYMAPLFGVIFAVSIAAIVFGLEEERAPCEFAAVLTATTLQLLPVAALVCVFWVVARCEHRISDRELPAAPHGS